MPSFADRAASRRKFLQFLAGSPLLAAGGQRAIQESPTLQPPRRIEMPGTARRLAASTHRARHREARQTSVGSRAH
jgi:hypothetical protein